MKRVLAFGYSGGVGRALQARVDAHAWSVVAVTRQAPPADTAQLRWLRGALPALPAPEGPFDLLLSLGPLDRFAEWFAGAELPVERVIALGSMSVVSKRTSRDPLERAQAEALRRAEANLFERGRARSVGITVLRPTLVYGTGTEASLAPLVQLARRWRVCPIPVGASGRRQPVHVDDIATAILACADTPATIGQVYALPGGETLALGDVLRRTVAARAPGAWVVSVPSVLWSLGAWLLARRRSGPVSPGGFLGRRAQDQCADAAPARADFGYAPGPFRP